MAAQRPAILAALKTVLINGVSAVAGKVYLPWDAIPESAETFLQIEVEDSRFEPALTGHWDHFLTVRVGAVKKGKFDPQAVWDLLDAAVLAMFANNTLGGAAINSIITGGSEHITEAGERILWPHLDAEIHYRTPEGHL